MSGDQADFQMGWHSPAQGVCSPFPEVEVPAVSSEVRCAGTCSADDMPPPPAPALGDRCDVPAVPYVGEQSPSAFRGRHQEIKRNQTEKGARESQDRVFSVGI